MHVRTLVVASFVSLATALSLVAACHKNDGEAPPPPSPGASEGPGERAGKKVDEAGANVADAGKGVADAATGPTR